LGVAVTSPEEVAAVEWCALGDLPARALGPLATAALTPSDGWAANRTAEVDRVAIDERFRD
jgi:hypothetical protein